MRRGLCSGVVVKTLECDPGVDYPVTSRSTSFGIADFAIVKYLESNSTPTLFRPRYVAAAIVDPAPIKGSNTTPFPRGSEARTKKRISACGLSEGWLATARSGR